VARVRQFVRRAPRPPNAQLDDNPGGTGARGRTPFSNLARTDFAGSITNRLRVVAITTRLGGCLEIPDSIVIGTHFRDCSTNLST